MSETLEEMALALALALFRSWLVDCAVAAAAVGEAALRAHLRQDSQSSPLEQRPLFGAPG